MTSKNKKILFITNGHGEDVVAAQIIRHLRSRALKIDVMPVVGKAEALKGLKVRLVGPIRPLPSGGFGLRNFSFFLRDVFAGLIGKALSQIRVLRKNKGKYDLVIGIGDIVPIVYSMFTGSKFIFVGINKSDYYKKPAFNYTGFEKYLLRNNCVLTLTRDNKTAETLSLDGIKTKYVGNPMMDGVKPGVRGKGLGVRKTKTIGFLPGTREDAYQNIEDFYKIAWRIRQLDKTVKFIMSIPTMLDRSRLSRIRSLVEIDTISDFNKVLKSSSVIIGLSGTGNEQAAGAGIPVIAFPGRGAQFNIKFAAGQKELLGDSLLLLPRDSRTIAHEAMSLIYNKKRIRKMGLVGKERMGSAGASKKIANIIMKELARGHQSH